MTPQYPDPTDDAWLQLHYYRILDLEDDWDGEGSPAYSIETLRTAVAICRYLQDETGIEFWDEIAPGPHGSLDVDKKFDNDYELLLNIDKEIDGHCLAYYGDDGQYKHKIDSSNYSSVEQRYNELIRWIRQVPR